MRHRVQKLIALAITVAAVAGCGRSETRWLVAYVSQDQVYAEPILAQFTRETGIAVRAVYDSEAVKTSGLVNRLLAERQHPQCDLFWNNESLRTQQLVERGLIASNGWRSQPHAYSGPLCRHPRPTRQARTLSDDDGTCDGKPWCAD